MDNKRGLYGNELQRRLQAASLATASAFRDTPGAVFAARMAGTDDPEAFGWDRIDAILRDEGAITFRMIPVDQCAQIEERLGTMGCTISWWDVFDGSADDIRAACESILNAPPKGFVLNTPSVSDDSAIFERAQAFMAKQGVAPYPAQVLSGNMGAAALAVLSDPEDGPIAATAFSYFPYNRHSAHEKTAWAGLVAVREDLRGRGIGPYVNARVLMSAVQGMGAERVQEFARTSNLASCRMIGRCGLSLRSNVRSGIAQPAEAMSFTR